MKKLVLIWTISALTLVMSSLATAADLAKFKHIAQSTMEKVNSGSVKDADIDKLINMQKELIAIGKQAIKEYVGSHPKTAKMLDLVHQNADGMSSLSLSDIEKLWHEKEFLKSNGIRTEALEEKSVTGSLMDTVVHPATAIIALRSYKSTKDKKFLQQVNDELEEVVNHVDLIKL